MSVSFFDAESVAGHLVEPGSVFRLLADQRRVLFPPLMFEDLFPSERGRPSIPVDIVASVLVLQALHGLSDREALAALRTDLRWKVAAGLPIGHAGFDPSTLTYWPQTPCGLAASASDRGRGAASGCRDGGVAGQEPAGVGLHDSR